MKTKAEMNELRLYANEIMRQLYMAGERGQLDLLKMYAEVCIKQIDAGNPKERK